MATKDEQPPKKGRPAGNNRRTYSVILDEDMADWAKDREGGLSGTIRRLLRKEHDSQNTQGLSELDTVIGILQKWQNHSLLFTANFDKELLENIEQSKQEHDE